MYTKITSTHDNKTDSRTKYDFPPISKLSAITRVSNAYNIISSVLKKSAILYDKLNMNTFRQLNYRRFVVTVLLLAGLLPQMRTVFACELIDGVLQFSCCCDEPGEMNCDKHADNNSHNNTNNNANCDNHSPALAKECCDISYHAVSTSINANTVGIHATGVRTLMLDAPQPPPGAVFNNSFAHSIFVTSNIAYTIISDIQSAKAGKSTYLRTLRLRI